MSFKAFLKTIGQIFSEKILYVLPVFQRPFSWTADEAIQLLDDFSIAFADEPSEHYFLGMTVCSKQGPMEEPIAGGIAPRPYDVYEIVDGQQRFATLVILFAVLRDLSEDETEKALINSLLRLQVDLPPYEYQLLLFTNDMEIFLKYIQPPGATLIKSEDENLKASQEKILHIREIFKTRLLDMAPEHRTGLTNFIIERVQMNHMLTDDIDTAYKIFTTINQTGVSLSKEDIGRATILGDDTIPAEQREQFTRDWRRREDQLGADFEMIFSHIHQIYGRRGSKVIAENQAIARDLGGSANYVTKIFNPACDALVIIRNPEARNLPEKHPINRYLTMLHWLRFETWIPPAIQFIDAHKGDNDAIEEFLNELHRLSFGMAIRGMGSPKRLTRYRRLSRDIRDGTVWDKSNSGLYLNSDEQKDVLYRLTHDLYNSSSQSTKLVLLLVNDLLTPDGDLSRKPSDITVEHVFPRRPRRNSDWLKLIFTDATKRDDSRGSLGNQIPLPMPHITKNNVNLNRAIENMEYQEKRDMILPWDDRGELRQMTEFTLVNRLSAIDVWDYQAIMENEKIYLDLLKKALRLVGPSGQELRDKKQKKSARSDSKK